MSAEPWPSEADAPLHIKRAQELLEFLIHDDESAQALSIFTTMFTALSMLHHAAPPEVRVLMEHGLYKLVRAMLERSMEEAIKEFAAVGGDPS